MKVLTTEMTAMTTKTNHGTKFPLEEFAKTRTVSSTSRGKKHKKDGKTLGEIGDWEAKELKKDSPRRL